MTYGKQSSPQVEKIKKVLMKFYSFKMFLFEHNELFKSNKNTANELKRLFMVTYPYNFLSDLLDLNYNFMGNDKNVRKSIVLSNQKFSLERFDLKNIFLSDLEGEQATQYLETNFKEFFREDVKQFIIHFDVPDSCIHFEYLISQVDSWILFYDDIRENMKIDKHIIFIFYKSPDDPMADINFLDKKWSFYVIENLRNSNYSKMMEIIDLDGDCFKSVDQDQLAIKIILNYLYRLNAVRNLKDLVDRILKPHLNSNHEYLNNVFVRFHSTVSKKIKTVKDQSWKKRFLNSQDQNLEQIILTTHRKDYETFFKNFIHKLKYYEISSTLIMIDHYSDQMKTDFLKIFERKEDLLYTNLRYICIKLFNSF